MFEIKTTPKQITIRNERMVRWNVGGGTVKDFIDSHFTVEGRDILKDGNRYRIEMQTDADLYEMAEIELIYNKEAVFYRVR